MAEAFQANGEAIAKVVIDLALAGDLTAASLVLQRLVPPKRPVSERTPFALDTTKPLAAQAAAVVQACADGCISVDDAKTVLSCLSSYAALVQADEVQARLAALERATAAPRSMGGVMVVDMPGGQVQ
jgi:hypothetical protein